MKKIILTMIMTIAVLSLIAGCSSGKTTGSNTVDTTKTVDTTADTTTDNTQTTASKEDVDQDGIPNAVEKTYGTNPYAADTDGDKIDDKNDDKPTFADMPFKTDGTAMSVEILDARVEDNSTDDHLEIKLKNSGKEIITGLEIYYTIEDNVANLTEAYYQDLSDINLKNGEEITLHFDNLVGSGHYAGNNNGIYGTSVNGPRFTITLHDDKNSFTTFTLDKDTGAAEVAD
jgi:hypothetical protein